MISYIYPATVRSGETITVPIPFPIRNILSITNVSVVNASVDLRIAQNTAHFDDWISVSELPATIDQNKDPIIEVRITATANLTNPEILISGTPTVDQWEFVDLSNTAYSVIDATSIRFETLWLNLFMKLYGEGIVPSFIDRDSEDYVSYFKYLAISFALNIELAEYYLTSFHDDPQRLREYLEQKSLLVCESAGLAELQGIQERTIAILRDRGTHKIDDEIKSWLCVGDCESFFFEYAPRFMSGWTIDRSSPNYTGRLHYQMNAAPTAGPGIYQSDGLRDSGVNVNYVAGDGIGALLLEDGGKLLLESTNPSHDFDGENLITQYDIVRDIVCIGDAPVPPSFLLQEEGGYIVQNSGGGILISTPSLVQGAENYIEFDVCINTAFDYELRFEAKADIAAGIRVDITTDSDVLYDNTPLDQNGGFPALLDAFTIYPSRGFTRVDKWTPFRLPFAPHPAPQQVPTRVNGAIVPQPGAGYVAAPRRHLPAYGMNQFWLNGYEPQTVKVTIRITNPYRENLYLHNISFGPTSLDNLGARLDAYNTATLVYQDKVGIDEIDEIVSKTRNYLIPYGATLYTEKLPKT